MIGLTQVTANPFEILIALKKQEAELAISISQAQADALAYHLKTNPTQTGRVAEIGGAFVTISLVSKKPAPTSDIKALTDAADKIEKALKTVNETKISELTKEIEGLQSNKESIALRSKASELLKAIPVKTVEQICITLPKGEKANGLKPVGEVNTPIA